MGEISIKVIIADRPYPLRIEADDEENVRKAAKLINERAKDYSDSFSVKDKQDVLSMCALEFASDLVNQQNRQVIEDTGISDKVRQLENLLSDIDL